MEESFEGVIKYLYESIENIKLIGIMGIDGLPVALQSKEVSETGTESIEFSSILSSSLKVSKNLNLGLIDEIIISTLNYTVVVKPVNENYFLGLLISSPVNLGRIKLEVKKISPILQKLVI